MISDEIRERAHLAYVNSIRRRYAMPPLKELPTWDTAYQQDVDAALSAVLPLIVEKCAEHLDETASYLRSKSGNPIEATAFNSAASAIRSLARPSEKGEG